MTDIDEKSPGAMHNAILRLLDDNASLRKQLDEAREREAQMADGMVALVKLHASELAHIRAANAQMAAALRLAKEYVDEWEMADSERVTLRAGIDAALSQEPPASHAPGDEEKGACPNCGCEEVDHRDLWTCRCPASHAPGLRDDDTPPAPAISDGDVIAVLRDLQTKAPEVEGPLRDAINDALEAALAAADRSAT